MFSDSYIARLNFIHTDDIALAYRSIGSPFTKPSSYAPEMCRIMGEFGNQTMNIHITLTVLPEESEIASTATFGAAIAGVGTP